MRVAVVEDEPPYRELIRQRLESQGVPVDVFDRPRRMPEDVGIYSHGVIDLAMGKMDLDQPEHGVPEVETGGDAIYRLSQVDADIVVMTRLDTPLLVELGKAIRQTWPAIRFLYKEDPTLADKIEKWVINGFAVDSSEIALDLADLDPIDPAEIKAVVDLGTRKARVSELLLYLADSGATPTIVQVRNYFRFKDCQSARNLVSQTSTTLRDVGYFEDEKRVPLLRLWTWCRARRAILHGLFA